MAMVKVINRKVRKDKWKIYLLTYISIDVLTWDTVNEKWNFVGKMASFRYNHAVTPVVISFGSCTLVKTTTPVSSTQNSVPPGIKNVMNEVDCFDESHSIFDTLPFIDIFLNPNRSAEKQEKIDHQKNVSREYFANLTSASIYPELFRLLWHSSLPCSPQPALAEESLVKSCQVAGNKVDCARLFTKVPTDVGLCCALNTESILKQSEYGQLVDEMQLEETADKVNYEARY